MSGKTYKIRKFKNGQSQSGDDFVNFSLTVPSDIARQLPENLKFSCKLTKEGILFSPVEAGKEELPEWARRNGKISR
jgi:hypothetical protein